MWTIKMKNHLAKTSLENLKKIKSQNIILLFDKK